MRTDTPLQSHEAPGGRDLGDRGSSRQWAVPKPERIPRPTPAPAATALGITLIAFGALTSTIISAAGAVLFAVAAARWIKEMHDAAED
jgi:hypothetical protein